MDRNHALAVAGRKLLLEALHAPEPAPEFMLGSLAAVPLPDWKSPVSANTPFAWHPLQRALLEKHRIEVPVMTFPPPHLLVRIAAQAYNAEAQYARLAAALRTELA